ncbi:uncharacterized protein BDCG_08036 [Blastomyces dermatitidis ER-3]|uniref:Uncharacterized protein n=2 Tax=Ajellomyces dermatitidis TaxID=5039 RepID=F2TJT0_AJEDA|nr:uncharacterized protein BDCG_08036 [Blastomyces dermatitidis ER-3]EEQ84767.1 hypothetical protein BDCG_08036 [Blastomyces dermatitidis ER-3]EGE83485.2 hypothetical protein BDDG_06429 [Blastomyces dermatitidis ATCC 18188]
MKRLFNRVCLLLVLVGISGGLTNARILGPREHQKFSQQGKDLQSNNLLRSRSSNGHIIGAAGVAVPPTHNSVTFNEGGIVINVINSGDSPNVHGQDQGHASLFPPARSLANSPELVAFESPSRTTLLTQSVGQSPSSISPELAAEPSGNASIRFPPAPRNQTAPFAIPTTQVQQSDIAADACDCQCLCPFHFFSIPAMNLASTVDMGDVPPPTTLATIVSPSVPGDQVSSTAAAAPFFPPANSIATSSSVSPTIPDLQASSVPAVPIPPLALPKPSEDSIITATDTFISSVRDATRSAVEFVTPNEPVPAPPRETAVTNTEVTQPITTETDVTQPVETEVEPTPNVAVSPEDPATITDADFTQQATENADVSATAVDAPAETDADSTQMGITQAPTETAAPEVDPVAAERFDISTMSLHSVLTLRLGG